MKLELKENMYIRTKDGIIAKIKEIDANERLYLNQKSIYTDDYKHDLIIEYEVIKASFNIIDLIEVGDYVNGYPVTAILSSNNKVYEIQVKRPNNRTGVWIENIRKNEDIKSIVTKEHFENISYRIGVSGGR